MKLIDVFEIRDTLQSHYVQRTRSLVYIFVLIIIIVIVSFFTTTFIAASTDCDLLNFYNRVLKKGKETGKKFSLFFEKNSRKGERKSLRTRTHVAIDLSTIPDLYAHATWRRVTFRFFAPIYRLPSPPPPRTDAFSRIF